MSRGIHFSKDEIYQSLRRLYEISQDMEECREAWRTVCEDCLFELPDYERSKIESIGLEIRRIQDQVRDQAETLEKVCAVYEKVEYRNRRLIGQLEKRLLETGGRGSLSGVSQLLRKWNGKVKKKLSINRKIIMEDWLQAYLLNR